MVERVLNIHKERRCRTGGAIVASAAAAVAAATVTAAAAEAAAATATAAIAPPPPPRLPPKSPPPPGNPATPSPLADSPLWSAKLLESWKFVFQVPGPLKALRVTKALDGFAQFNPEIVRSAGGQ